MDQKNNIINFTKYRMQALEKRFLLDGEAMSEFIQQTNSAPVIDISNDVEFDPISEDLNPNLNIGNTVSELLNQLADYNDPDGDPRGIAITGLSNDLGQWQFSIDGGLNWSFFNNVTSNSATLLNADARIRFLPAENQNGQAAIEFRAWDQTTGSNGMINVDTNLNGGSTSFSTAIETAKIDIISVNSSPTFAANDNVTLETIQNGDEVQGQTVFELFSSLFDDPDSFFSGVAIVFSENDKLDGSWLFSTDGGQTFQEFPQLSDSQAVVLGPNDILAYSPTSVFSGSPGPLSARLFDGSSSIPTGQPIDITSDIGLSGAFSNGTRTVNIFVTPPDIDPFESGLGLEAEFVQKNTSNIFETASLQKSPPLLSVQEFQSSGDKIGAVSTLYQFDFENLDENEKKKKSGDGSFEQYRDQIDPDFLPESNRESQSTEDDIKDDAAPNADSDDVSQFIPAAPPNGHISFTEQIRKESRQLKKALAKLHKSFIEASESID